MFLNTTHCEIDSLSAGNEIQHLTDFHHICAIFCFVFVVVKVGISITLTGDSVINLAL